MLVCVGCKVPAGNSLVSSESLVRHEDSEQTGRKFHLFVQFVESLRDFASKLSLGVLSSPEGESVGG